MRKCLIILMLFFLLFSCKTTRYASTETQTNTVEQKDISEQVTETVTENSVTETDETETIKITVFSIPDSSGNQYVVSVTEIFRDKTSSNKKNIVAEKETLHIDKSQTQKIENVRITEKSEMKTKTPCWVYVVIVVFGLVVIVLILWALRKYKVF